MKNLSLVKSKHEESESLSTMPGTARNDMPPSSTAFAYSLDDDKYANMGFQHAIENQASADTYQLMLNHLVRHVHGEDSNKRDVNSRVRQDVEDANRAVIAEKEKLQRESAECVEKAKKLEARKAEVLRNPTSLHATESPYDPTREKIMMIGLFALTAFLYFFYFLTGHAAFMKNIGTAMEKAGSNNVSALFETVFDASSVIADIAVTPVNAVLCGLFPFVFIVTGYLVHHFMEKKQYPSMLAAVAITLGLDFTLAYKVTSKMYDARHLGGLEDKPWHFSMVFSDVNFYLILLAGMAVYVLWGILMGLYLEEHRRGDVVSSFVAASNDEIAALEKSIRELDEKIAQRDRTIEDNQLKIARIDDPGSLSLVSRNQIELVLDSFTSGWSRGVQKFYQQEQERLDQEKSRRSAELLTLLNNFKTAIKADSAVMA
ncbi:MAG: hypothetical protein WCP10_15140 [Desulfuromonadales bacterium]